MGHDERSGSAAGGAGASGQAPASRLGSFLAELRRRRVVRALVAWGVVSFAVLQVIDPIMRLLGLPEPTLRVVGTILALGFPVVGALSWVFDVTSGGIRRTAAAVPAAAGTAGGPSIAVLPFADMSPGRDQEYFADGVAEEILNALAQVEGLHVTGRTSSFSFKGRNARIEEIARELRVSTLLEGSVRKEGARVRVTAQVVSASDGYRLWSRSFDRELTDIFAVQDEIARAVVEALRVKLLPGRAPTTRGMKTEDPEVYREYLVGRELARRNTLDGWTRALAAHERALALDPGYAPAWAGLAFDIRFIEGLGGMGTSPERRRRALEAADRAVALAPELADGYWVRATIRMGFELDWDGARSDLDRARALSPNDADVAAISGQLLVALGRLDEAVAVLRRATELDPLSALAWERLGVAHTFAGDLERGREALLRALEIVPDGPLATLSLYMNLLPGGAAREVLARARRLPPGWLRLVGEALAQHDLDQDDEADAALQQLIAGHATESAYQIAEVHAWHGKADPAFAWLERAHAQRDPGLVYTRGDTLLRPLHGDPRWGAFLRKLNLPAP